MITGYRAERDLRRICRHVEVVAAIPLRSRAPEDFAGFAELVGRLPHVVECTKVSGTIDYLVRVVSPDLEAYHELSDRLLTLGPKVADLSSHVVLESVKPFQGYAIEDLL